MLLIIAALTLLAVIAYQNWATPALRNETISDGLYPDVSSHWLLVAAYALLATALVNAFIDVSHAAMVLSIISAVALAITAFTNSFPTWVDKVTGGLHAKIHTLATIAMFLAMLTLEGVVDSGWLIWVSVASVWVPLVVGGVMSLAKSKLAPGPVAEKLAVLCLCSWMITWSLA
jgi:hypothetical protein